MTAPLGALGYPGPGLELAGVPDFSPGSAPTAATAPAVLPVLLPAPAPALEAAALQLRSGDAPGPGPAAKRERGVAPDAAKLQSLQPLESSGRAKPTSGRLNADPRAAEERAPASAFRAEFAFLGIAAAAIALFAVGVICCWTHCCASCCRQAPGRARTSRFMRLPCEFAEVSLWQARVHEDMADSQIPAQTGIVCTATTPERALHAAL